MPVYNGKAFCYDRHSTRFENSAKRYGLELPDVDRLAIVKELKKLNDVTNAFVWFLVWRGAPPSGNPRDIENCPIHFAMYIKPSYPIANNPIVNLQLDTNTNRVSDDYYGQEYKNMAWLDLTMSQRNKPADADTTILVDVDGHVTEGPGFNVGIVSNGVIYTADKNVLKGITMTVVEDIARNNGIMFCRLPISQEEFNNATEVFITSSSGGVTATQKSGPITQQLMTEYEKMKDTYATDLG
jgi:branched-chain amino acid aminotransferase